jgi:hypothetical protein
MNLSLLKEKMRPWMKIKRWHTEHPCDDERFHLALKAAFDQFGVKIQYADFKEVMKELADEYYPDWNQTHREECIEKFALRKAVR